VTSGLSDLKMVQEVYKSLGCDPRLAKPLNPE
jgi:hypothetical protein